MDRKIIDLLCLEFVSDESDNDENFLSSSSSTSFSEEEIEINEFVLDDFTREKTHCIENFVEKTIPSYSNEEFQRHFRVNRDVSKYLVEKLEKSVEYNKLERGKVYSADTHIAMFLWFAGHEACSFRDLADRFDVAISTASLIVTRVTYFISQLSKDFIRWPNNEEKAASSAYFGKNFNGTGFEGAIGALDRTNIHKGQTTVQLQAICNEKKKFIDIFVGYPGSVDDNRVFENSEIFQTLPTLCGEYFILASSAYGCTEHVITPYRDDGHLSARKKHFNNILGSRRIYIEHAFGMLKQRFPQLYYCKLKGNEKLCHFIRACSVLHNMCDDDFIPTEQINESIKQEQVEIILPELSTVRRNQLCERLFTVLNRN